MNGVILNDIGLEPMIDALQVLLLRPISAEVFPLEGAEFDSHHTFIVKSSGPDRLHLAREGPGDGRGLRNHPRLPLAGCGAEVI